MSDGIETESGRNALFFLQVRGAFLLASVDLWSVEFHRNFLQHVHLEMMEEPLIMT
jgi:hypothetical protein